ncbi:MAG: hypothetical protein V1886_03485 [archaeon]
MENKMKEYNLKLPSSSIVNLKSSWEVLKIISKTGKTFTDKDVVKNGSPINENNLFRVLSYLKYLGLLVEKREREVINGKEESVQRWMQEDNKDVTEFFFLLRDNREEEAKKILIELIKKHDLFLSIKDELINGHPSITVIDLKDFFRKKIPEKSPSYYDNGIKFTIDFLLFCKLIFTEGNIIKLKEQESKHEEKKEEPQGREQTNEAKKNITLGENKYIVSIFGKNTNFEFPINQNSDIEDVEAILNIIRKKLT